MKKLIKTLFFIIFLTSVAQADDITDYEIEGMRIGESALEYFNKNEIEKNIQNYYPNKEVLPVWLPFDDKLNTYDGVQFHYKKNDKEFKFLAISGVIWHKNDYKGCMKKLETVDQNLKDIFKNASRKVRRNEPHNGDPSGESIFSGVYYVLNTKDFASVICYDWSDNLKQFGDNLRVSLRTKEYQDWINNKAYK